MDKPAETVVLSKPITLASGELLKEIVLREPTALDLRKMPMKQELELGMLLDLAADVAGLPYSTLNQLCAVDTFAVAAAMGKALGGGTGVMP